MSGANVKKSKKLNTKKAPIRAKTAKKKFAPKKVQKRTRGIPFFVLISICALCISAVIVSFCCFPRKHVARTVFDYVLDAGTFKTIDYSYEKKLNEKQYDNWGGCTAVAKNIDGNTIIGRNMDLYISNKPAYVFKTDIKGRYKTLNLAYTYRDYAPDYEDAKNGLEDDFYNVLPFISDDVLNEKGLYIEVNMREAEGDKFSCSGTNPDSAKRVYMFSLPIYIGLNAANIDEALDYIKTLDIYSKKGYWNYAFLMADATGRYGVLEIAQNQIFWNEGQNAQANFYVTNELGEINELKIGVGRYDYVREHVDGVQDKNDMFNLMNDIRYSQTYEPGAKFDVRSEFVNAQETCGLTGAAPWTYGYVIEDSAGVVKECIGYLNELASVVTREDRKEMGAWESSFTEVVDLKNKAIDVRFFEDDNKKYTLSF